MSPVECPARAPGHHVAVLRFVRFAAVLGAFVGASAGAAEVAAPLEPSLEIGVDKGAGTFPSRLGFGLSVAESSLYARDHAGHGYFIVRPKGDGSWQVATVAAGGRINPWAGGLVLADSGTTYILNSCILVREGNGISTATLEVNTIVEALGKHRDQTGNDECT